MRLSLLLTSSLLISACGGSDPTTEPPTKPEPPIEPTTLHSDKVQQLWQENITDLITSEPLWQSDYAYDTANVLMLPMHYAYQHKERFTDDPRHNFEQFFANVESAFYPQDIENRVIKTQFLYFISQYLKLQIESSRWSENETVNLLLLERIESALNELWYNLDAVHWDASLQFTGIKQRLEWKLSSPAYDYAYYGAIIDEEMFSLAIMNDLAFIKSALGQEYGPADEIKAVTRQVITTQGSFDGTAWFFQKGQWHDHRDYAYAGHAALGSALERSEVSDIAIDSSHSHRMPLWLKSFADAADSNNDSLYVDALAGFRHTFETFALKTRESEGEFQLLQTNYLDGRNGLYRYSYSTLGDDNGYGPFELSGTLLVGYYAFSGSQKYAQGMRRLANSFPLSHALIETYTGPASSRYRHPSFQWPEYFSNGFAQTFSFLASCYQRDIESCEGE